MHILCTGIETWAGFRHGIRHVAVATYHSSGEELAEFLQESEERCALLRRARVGGTAGGVQSALVTDADAATVVRAAVCTHFKELAVLGNGAVAADVKMVADGAESTCPVVA